MDFSRNYRRIRFRNQLIFILIACLVSAELTHSANAQADKIKTDVFPLQTFDSRFYTVYLNENETITINISSAFNGDFDIFIFKNRPIDTYVSKNGYDPKIFDIALNYNNSTGAFSSLQYKADNNTIIYIQIVLISQGTDTFYLTSLLDHERVDDVEWELNLYFIPFIPGVSVELIITMFVLSAFSVMIFLIKRKKIKITMN